MEVNGERWLIERVAPDASFFIDVGANVGHWTSAFLDAGNHEKLKGLLFEPSPETFSVLSNNVRSFIDNGVLEISSSAVSDRTGQMSFYTEFACGETSSLIQGHSNPESVEIVVDVTTVDREIESRKIAYVDILKIDAEGYDLHVLKGSSKSLRLSKIGLIQFEYNHPWAYAGSTLYEAIQLLEGFGYAVYLLRSDGLHVFDYKIYGEYYGYSNFVAISINQIDQYSHYICGDS
jgi:FkbM family methyltransferase